MELKMIKQKLYWLILLIFVINLATSINYSFAEGKQKINNKRLVKSVLAVSDWVEDCSDISDWTDARGTDFEVNAFRGYQENLTDSLIASAGVFTPEVDWWNPPASNTTHRRAAVYRELPTTWTEILINSTINFDPTSVSNPYTFQGGLYLILTNSNHEQLFELEIRDGAASSGKHDAYHHASYFDSSDLDIELLPITLAASPVITNGKLSIHIKETTVEVFTPISNEWIDLGISPTVAFQRGTPKYVVLFCYQNRQLLQPPPTELNWDSIEVQTKQQTDNEIQVPTPPQNLQTISGDNQVILSWEPPLDIGNSSITEYRVYRSTYPSHYTYIGKTSSLGYIDTSVSNGLTYYYIISAINIAGESDFSNAVSVVPGITSTTTITQHSSITPGFSIIWIIISALPIILSKRKIKRSK